MKGRHRGPGGFLSSELAVVLRLSRDTRIISETKDRKRRAAALSSMTDGLIKVEALLGLNS